MAASDALADRPDRGAIIAVAFATVVVMWLLVYVLMMPALGTPGWVAASVLGVCLLGGGFAIGRLSGGSWGAGMATGLVIALVNLLIFGSLAGGDEPDEVLVSAVKPIAGFFGLALMFGAVGGVVGASMRSAVPPIRWTSVMAYATATATFMLLMAGGIVTGQEAGLAIEGWLTANDYLLVLFPLRLMQEHPDVYAEHTHRLWGLLVGLSTIMLVGLLLRNERRRWLSGLGIAALLGVIVQGVMGGTRVTEASTVLAIAHGIFGQIVFATIVAIAVMSSRAFREMRIGPDTAPRPADRTMCTVLVVMLLVQLTLGAMYRHLHAVPDGPTALVHSALALHVLIAAAVFLKAIVLGGRMSSSFRSILLLCNTGRLLIGVVVLQVALGVSALMVVLKGRGEAEETMTELVVTTMHQTTGALLLATAVALMVGVLGATRRPID